MKISSSHLGLNTTLSGGQTLTLPAPTNVHPLSILLFGKRPARRLDARRYPKLKKALRKLQGIKEQVAELAGFPEAELTLELCEGANASISREGKLGVGKELLEEFPDDDELWVAILGHEVGHAPWTWPKMDLSRMRKKDRDALYREEEAKADRFAGRVMADLGVDPRRICDFLLQVSAFESHAPSDYYPAEIRTQMILQSCGQRTRMLERGRAVLGHSRKRELR